MKLNDCFNRSRRTALIRLSIRFRKRQYTTVASFDHLCVAKARHDDMICSKAYLPQLTLPCVFLSQHIKRQTQGHARARDPYLAGAQCRCSSKWAGRLCRPQLAGRCKSSVGQKRQDSVAFCSPAKCLTLSGLKWEST